VKKTTTIVIPILNERDNIKPLVKKIDDTLSEYAYEILFVDDGSKDGTTAEIKSLASEFPLELLERKGKKGLASAVADGITKTKSEYLVVMDADLQHPPELLPRLIKAIIEEDNDIAVASRYTKGGGGTTGWRLWRRLVSKGATTLSHLLLPKTRFIDDPMSGYFAFNRKVIKGIKLEPIGYKILLEIITLGNHKKSKQLPYNFKLRQAGQSKLGIKQQIEYLKHLFSLMRRGGEVKRFIRFCMVGFSGVGVNMGLLWFFTDVGGLYYLLSSIIAVEASILTNYTLNNFITFADRKKSGVGNFFKRMGKFNTISLAGLLINMSVLYFFTEAVGLYYLIANALGIMAATSWNYLVNNWWTWR